MKNAKFIPHANDGNRIRANRWIKTAGLFMLLGGCFLPRQTLACDGSTTTDAKVSPSQVHDDVSSVDYYQSTDNPFRGD